jgi:NADPH-dependent curcumin reductase CurA
VRSLSQARGKKRRGSSVCSASRTGIATAPWRSTRPSRHATSRHCPGDVDFTVGASLPISGLTAWQGLFEHGRLRSGQRVLVHGAAGAVGSMVTQLAREFGAYVIGTGRAAREERLRTNIGNVSSLDEAVAAFNATGRRQGKTIIRLRS